jgi:hypothetical protein
MLALVVDGRLKVQWTYSNISTMPRRFRRWPGRTPILGEIIAC